MKTKVQDIPVSELAGWAAKARKLDGFNIYDGRKIVAFHIYTESPTKRLDLRKNKLYDPVNIREQWAELVEEFKVDLSHENYYDEDTGDIIYSGRYEAEVLLGKLGWVEFTSMRAGEAVCRAVIASVFGEYVEEK